MLESIKYYNEYKILPEIDSSQQWAYYKDIEGDVTSKFFKHNTSTVNIPNIKLAHNTKDTLADPQFISYYNINYKDVSPFIDKYFTPSEEVDYLANNILQKYNIDLKNTIGVCYRGNDKHTETHLPSYEEVLSKIEEVLKKSPNSKILLQSDEIEFCDFMKRKFPNAIIIDETKKINKSNTAIQFTVESGNKVIQAQTFLAVMQILSKCSTVILNSGNVGLWICLFRKNSKEVHQYLNIKTDICHPDYLGIPVDEHKWVLNENKL